ncbi:MAG: hypothetical protein IJG60_08640 [Thermoguttaceae bacterium]|nr:hypothetical protein [Thermoguttaceae bacterium]
MRLNQFFFLNPSEFVHAEQRTFPQSVPGADYNNDLLKKGGPVPQTEKGTGKPADAPIGRARFDKTFHAPSSFPIRVLCWERQIRQDGQIVQGALFGLTSRSFLADKSKGIVLPQGGGVPPVCSALIEQKGQ